MAAYGALVSLMYIIDRLEKHPSPPVSIDKQQAKSLTEIVTFLQDFLDGYISPVIDDHEADPLERRIADAVYAAEDVIESQIVVQIDNRSTIRGKKSNFITLIRALCKCATIAEDFYHDLQQVIEEMNLIKNEAMEIVAAAAQLQRKVSSTHAASSSTVKEIMMVGFDEVLLEVLDKLTGGQLSRQIIPIMGMGGIDFRRKSSSGSFGKTAITSSTELRFKRNRRPQKPLSKTKKSYFWEKYDLRTFEASNEGLKLTGLFSCDFDDFFWCGAIKTFFPVL